MNIPNIVIFSANRYYGSGPNAMLEKWLVETKAYKVYDGIRIPSQCKVSWKLKTGNFNWLNLEITDLEFNKAELYK